MPIGATKKSYPQAKAALERDADKVLRALAKLSAGMTKNAIRDHAGLSGARANAAIAWLLDAGAIQSCELTISNHRTHNRAIS